MSPRETDSRSPSSKLVTAVPDGFVVVTLQDGSPCIVPEFLVPATNDAFDGYRTYLAGDIREKLGGSVNKRGYSFVRLGENEMVFPADPPLTQREIAGLHHEINALRERYGISYKDAAHRLYMTESEKIRADDRSRKAFSILAKRTQGSLLKLETKFNEINEALVDDAEAEE